MPPTVFMQKKSNKTLGCQNSWHKLTKVTWMAAEIRYPYIVPDLYLKEEVVAKWSFQEDVSSLKASIRFICYLTIYWVKFRLHQKSAKRTQRSEKKNQNALYNLLWNQKSQHIIFQKEKSSSLLTYFELWWWFLWFCLFVCMIWNFWWISWSVKTDRVVENWQMVRI